jgi:RND family efflux transporter MFP subunit
MRLLCLSMGVLLTLGGVCHAAGFEAITRPSDDRTLAFVRAGKISKVLVKDGDTVKAGQLLIQLDDAAERAQLEQLVAQAKDQTRVKAAEAQLAQKKEDLKKLQMAEAKKWDIAHAKLDIVIADLSLDLAKFEAQQSGRKVAEAKILLGRMQMHSPIAGKVEKIVIHEGESADALQPLIRVVKIDPLWADVPVARAEALKLKIGGKSTVTLVDEDAAAPGKIVYIAAVGDAASNTLTVRVEFANQKGRPAGEHVTVTFLSAGEPARAP